MSLIWAKSQKENKEPIRLVDHINDLLIFFDKLFKKIRDNDLKDIIKLVIILHDLGKAFPTFQIRMLGNKDYEPFYIYHNLPHSLLSILLINQEKLPQNYKNLILSSVAFHHWRDNFIDLLTNSEEFGKLYLDIKTYIPKIEENLKEELKSLKVDLQNLNIEDLIKFQENIANGLLNGVPYYEYLVPPYHYYWLPKRIELDEDTKKKWIYMSGFLQRCDHFASFCEEEEVFYNPEIDNLDLEEIKQNILSNFNKKNFNFKQGDLWQFKIINEIKDENLILIAPTGYGKTELAFLWSNGEKLFYTLPLKAAVNDIFKRASQIFDNAEERAGLLHSDADIFLYSDGGEDQSNFHSYELSKQLSYPIIISTGDQFFPYSLRPPGYEKIYATFSYSRLVIDEIQAYNPKAVAIIIKYLEDIIKLSGKFLLMTATLPKYVEDEIKNRLNVEYKLINIYEQEQEKFEKIKKHKIQLMLINNKLNDDKKPIFDLPPEEIEKIIIEAQKGKRVLVIVNTIELAQNIYHKIKNEYNGKLFLLHSHFTFSDRERKEKDILEEFKNVKFPNEKEGKILIATQVVEASLNIDSDVLFTEIAPMDSLVQRMGRVLRRYGPLSSPEDIPFLKEPNVYIWIFKYEFQSGRNYIYNNDIIKLTLQILKDYPNLQDDYKNTKIIDITDIDNKNFIDIEIISEYDKFKLVSKLYDYDSLSTQNAYMKELNKTLEILDAGFMTEKKDEAEKLFREIYTISVIPEKFRDEFINDCKKFFQNNFHEKKQYSKFKKNILSKYVLSLNLYNRKNIFKKRVVDWFNEDDFDKNSFNKLKGWCKDIILIDIEYDDEFGCKKPEGKTSLII